MRGVVLSTVIFLLAGCSLNIPQKPAVGSLWHLRPAPVQPATDTKPFAVVVAKPWLTSGYDTRHVMVSLDNGEVDGLADVLWTASYGEWIRNYFIEGLQSSGNFTAVSGNLGGRDNLVFLRLYLWDLSVHYGDDEDRTDPVVKAKLGLSVTNGRGEKLLDQRIIESRQPVPENRLTAIIQGFDAAVADCFSQIRGVLLTL